MSLANDAMRLFVAIEIVPEIRTRITVFIAGLKPMLADARWVRPEGLHITLKFLGNVKDERSKSIAQALRMVQAPSLSLSVRSIGFFPNPRSPRVLWTGIEAGSELRALAQRVDEALTPLGFDREKRAFNPHVTLARFKDARGKIDVRSIEQQPSFGTMTATEFHLYESKLSPQGSHYSKLASFDLKYS
ncbi:MAG: RNA 2',3'-cyclic phosphodiesterase [Terriglobales bacterium]